MSTRRKLKCLLIFAIILFMLSLLFISFALHELKPPKVKTRFPVGPRRGYNPFVTIFPQSAHAQEKRKGVKTILLWTDFFGSAEWLTHPATFQTCVVKDCRVTAERGELREADAVLVNVRGISSPSDLPLVHPPHQVWVVHGSEPPYYINIHLASFNNVFNWTSWYRTDADIFSPYGHFGPRGSVRDVKPDGNLNASSSSSSSLSSSSPRKAPTAGVFQANYIHEDLSSSQSPRPEEDAGDAEDPFGLHDLLVFWAASSCINYAQRYKLVSALQELLPVDTYGHCGTKTCQRNGLACEKTLKRYKFVLAFENGYCRDYVTEKYWNALSRNQIPIVSGGADYSQITIPGSYIDVDNFSSVEELAQFILRVGSDRRLYNSFFTWRDRYLRLRYGVVNWCQMCAALHDKSRQPQVYSDLKGWVADDSCPVQSNWHHLRWLFQYVSFKAFGI
ncbi:alpha-(1,3)-fucosyltransferase C-like [Babylonia areolata]|uniref:alpha-(1,3)-fucosyltransferase C-like n=1 Tax=Babylonia areolata TaxID=304850 RepID=UPI003FCFCB15